ncbi:MAG: hypothetical protein M4D80_21690 [Myxococcota bacterium]|nr:hypothetical protein [Myxococcota bacterium]
MQSWQLLPIVIVAAVFGYTFLMRGKLRGKAQELYGNAMSTLQQTLANGATPGEANPICVIATERKMLSARIFYVGLTDRRLVLHEPGKGDPRTFDRRTVQLSICEKTFSDVGNMTTTVSRGYELKLVLPDGTRHACRVYAQMDGIPDHVAHVQALIAALPRAAA